MLHITPHRTDSNIEVYNDGKVLAELNVHDGNAVILEFSSHQPRKGNARKALQSLRAHYKTLVAQEIGHPGTDSYNFWVKMAKEGLIDCLADDDLEPVDLTDTR